MTTPDETDAIDETHPIVTPPNVTWRRQDVPGGLLYTVRAGNLADARDETAVASIRAQAMALGFRTAVAGEGPKFQTVTGVPLAANEIVQHPAHGVEVQYDYRFTV